MIKSITIALALACLAVPALAAETKNLSKIEGFLETTAPFLAKDKSGSKLDGFVPTGKAGPGTASRAGTRLETGVPVQARFEDRRRLGECVLRGAGNDKVRHLGVHIEGAVGPVPAGKPKAKGKLSGNA